MLIGHQISRRRFLTAVASVPAVAATRVAPARALENVPLITKRVERLYTVAGCRQPNDLQFTSEGLWILDQVDQPGNKVFLVTPETGAVIKEIMTDSIHGSGITYGSGALWITSTKMKNPKDPPVTLKVDPQTGKTLKSEQTVAVGKSPHEMAVSTDGSKAYVANTGENTVSVVDLTTRRVLKTLTSADFGTPHGVAFTPDGRYGFVTSEGKKKIIVIDARKDEIARAVDTDQERTHMVVVSPDSRWAYFTNVTSATVSVL